VRERALAPHAWRGALTLEPGRRDIALARPVRGVACHVLGDAVMARSRPDQTAWPTRLWLVRHGQSAGNVANDAAIAAGHPSIDIDLRDMDVPLSELGTRQADALGAWFGHQPASERPTVVVSSPYLRTMQTADRIVAALPPADAPLLRLHDERLREKELGTMDRLTKVGIVDRFPREAERRGLVGKFYYRPPGGESWTDVILRLRSLVDQIQIQHAGERVLVVTHQVLVLCFRYVLENLSESQILAIDAQKDVANCSVTTYALEAGEGPEGATLALHRYNDCEPIAGAGEPVTAAQDPPVGR
jgi:probable phosphoglycerate mutase